MTRGVEVALGLGGALLVSLGVVVHALLQQRRYVRSRLAAARSFAAALRDALGLDASLTPAQEPHREGMWAITATLRGRPLRALVGLDVVLLAVQLPGPAGADWDLVPGRELTARGGLYNDPADPHRPLDPAALGPSPPPISGGPVEASTCGSSQCLCSRLAAADQRRTR